MQSIWDLIGKNSHKNYLENKILQPLRVFDHRA